MALSRHGIFDSLLSLVPAVQSISNSCPRFLWYPQSSPSAIPVHSSLRPCPRSMFPVSGCHPEPETRGLDCQRISEGSFLFPLNVLSVCFYQSRQGDPTKFNLDHSDSQVSPKQTLNSVCVDSAFISSSLLTSLLAALLPSVLFLK